VVADLNARANQLRPVIQFGMASNLPSLVVAQILYGDATREADLTARNDPVNPGFLPLTIEALIQ
jgi:prophage DNA circulation protein